MDAKEDIVVRLRRTRADMIGTDDEAHYWDVHDAAGEIEKLRSLVRFQDRVIRSGDAACLTTEERASLEEAVGEFRERGNLASDQIAENLHRLTERLK